jgi:hypothetical protein
LGADFALRRWRRRRFAVSLVADFRRRLRTVLRAVVRLRAAPLRALRRRRRFGAAVLREVLRRRLLLRRRFVVAVEARLRRRFAIVLVPAFFLRLATYTPAFSRRAFGFRPYEALPTRTRFPRGSFLPHAFRAVWALRMFLRDVAR